MTKDVKRLDCPNCHASLAYADSEIFRLAVLEDTLARIARGRIDGGKPLAGEAARQLARETLTDLGRGW